MPSAPAPVAYLVTDRGCIDYAGDTKHADPGDTVTDLPADAIEWLTDQGYIVLAPANPTPATDGKSA